VIVDEFRSSLALYEQWLGTGEYPLPTLLHMVQCKLTDISNHVAVCHRNLAEHRCYAQLSLFGTRKGQLEKADRVGAVLEQVEEIQRQFLDLQFQILKGLFPEHMSRVQRSG
jgi:hypothetical protein